MKIAIDGPAGAGKSTISKQVAKELGFTYIDTGAMFRSIGLFCLNSGVDISKEAEVSAILGNISIELTYIDGTQHIILNGDDVSSKIRTEDVSMAASNVAVYPSVRTKLLELQRELAEKYDVVMDGRDIGTVVLPNAECKIFLTASAEARSERRYKELIEKGEECSLQKIYEDIVKRDKNDSERKTAPLKQADDAVLVDTSSLSLEESIAKVKEVVTNKIKEQ